MEIQLSPIRLRPKTRAFATSTIALSSRTRGRAPRLATRMCSIRPARCDRGRGDGPPATGPEETEPAQFPPPLPNDDTIAAAGLDRSRGELVVVDARIPSRWRGEPNPIDRVPGRIPGALNSPWNEPLRRLPEGEVVVYCGSGVTASAVLHRLHLAGRDARLYPGSWSEWEQLGLPVERS